MQKTNILFQYSAKTHLLEVCRKTIILFIISGTLNITAASEWSLSMAVVAKVNGEPITKYDIEKLAGRIARSYVSMHGEESLNMEKKETIARNALQALVRSKIIRQISVKNSIYIDPEKIENELKRKRMEDTRLNRDFAKDDLLFDKIMRVMGKPLLEASPRRVRDFYNEKQHLFKIPRQVKVRHITVSKATEMTKASELRKIKRYHKEATAGHMKFAELASKRATSPVDKKSGGLLLPPGSRRNNGFFRPDSKAMAQTYPKEMVTAIDKLKKGGISPVIESNIGFHIIYIEDEKEAKDISFEKSQKYIIRHLRDIERFMLQREWLEEVIKSSKITWHDGSPIPPDEVMPPKPEFDASKAEGK
ncbi:MAG: peptidylprolyl isomerase [Planctomycetota bacterium]|jgi:peptidyl-prolyl cis-trans isomerase C